MPSRRDSLAMIVIDKDVMVLMTDGVRLALIRKSSV
jgi:predicted acyl esterase